jgi:hypothetical protein
VEKEKLSEWMALNWRAGLAFVYSLVCVFDFIVAPAWLGLHRPVMSELLIQLNGFSPEIQNRIIETAFRSHNPYTLQGSGLVHLSFGALLTGAAITKLTASKNE